MTLNNAVDHSIPELQSYGAMELLYKIRPETLNITELFTH